MLPLQVLFLFRWCGLYQSAFEKKRFGLLALIVTRIVLGYC